MDRRVAAVSLLLIGLTMIRTVQGIRTDLHRILRSGGRVRIVVLDPTDEAVIAAAAVRYPENLTSESLKRRVWTTLEELMAIRSETDGRLEIRVASHVPTAGINGLDLDGPRGMICVQHYEFLSDAEPAPIFVMTPADGEWYRHFVAEAERIWEHATPWPLSPSQELGRARPMGFSDAFGPELDKFIGLSQNLFITGMARNNFISSRYHMLESYLTSGRGIRFLLIDPDSAALQMAADRYYAERSAASARNRVEHSLRLLAELAQATGGDLSVRLTGHPLAVGIIATDSQPADHDLLPTVFAEYYSYQAAGEPKFVLRPADEPWRKQFVEELWANSKPYQLVVR
jgi:hypothetical protein